MRAKFIRGAEGRKDILDRLLDRIITLEMPCYDIEIKNGELDERAPDTKFFADALRRSGVSFKYVGDDGDYVMIEIAGTKEQIIEALPLWDAHGRDSKELAEELEDWEGNPEQIMDLIT